MKELEWHENDMCGYVTDGEFTLDIPGRGVFKAGKGNAQEVKSFNEQRESILTALKAAIPRIEPHGITILLEPLNTHVDNAGYFLDNSDKGADIVR